MYSNRIADDYLKNGPFNWVDVQRTDIIFQNEFGFGFFE